MLQQMKKRLKNEKGLTLIELLAVIVILAIIAAIAIPAIGNIIDNSRNKALKSDAANIINAAQMYYADGADGIFTISTDGTGSGSSYVQLGDTTVTTEITVTEDGAISGALSKGGKTLTLTAATLSEIDIDSGESVTGKAVISE